MKKVFGLLLCSAALLFTAAPMQAQADEPRHAVKPEQFEQVYEQPVALEYSEVGEVTFATQADLSTCPEGELNPDTITIGGIYYDVANQQLIYAAEYKMPEGTGYPRPVLFLHGQNGYSTTSYAQNGYYSALGRVSNVTSMPTEALKFTAGFVYDGQWVAYKTIEAEPVEWNWKAGMDAASMHEDVTNVYVSLYLPAGTENAEFALFCGNQKVGTPRYVNSYSVSYVYTDFGLHTSIYHNMANPIARVSGTVYVAEKLDADKEYVVKAYLNDEWVTVGEVEVMDGIYVSSVSSVVVREEKPVVRVNFQGVSVPNFTIEVLDAEGEVLASAAGAPDIYTSRTSAMWILDTEKNLEELKGTRIYVKDENGTVLRSNGFSTSNSVYSFYYDYYNAQMVLLTRGIPDGTVISVRTANTSGECLGTATVAGNRAVVTFTQDGEPYDLETGIYYNFDCSYTVDGAYGSSYLYGQIYSLGGEKPDNYNDLYKGKLVEMGVTEHEFTIRVYKNTFDKYTGEASFVVINNNGAETGSVTIVEGPELRDWWLGNDKYTTPFYEYTLKWNGDALQEGYYSVLLFRGDEQVEKFNDGFYAVNPENEYGYFYISSSTDSMTVTYYNNDTLEGMDFSLMNFTFTDFAGNVLDLPVTLASANNSTAKFNVDKTNLPVGCLGLQCTATYNGKPVHNYNNPTERLSYQTNFTTIDYLRANTVNGLNPFYDAACGINAGGEVTAYVTEVGSTEVITTWNLKSGATFFDETMLAGLVHNDFSKPYSLQLVSADGYAGYYERIYFYILGEEIAGKNMKEVKAFVNRMYNIILEREPDADSKTWIDGLMNGTFTGVRVADGFIMSNELLNKNLSNEEFVKILYRAFFGREADAEGLATWKGLLDSGCKKAYVFAGFANSNEFGNLCAEAGIEQGRAAEYLADRQPGLSEKDYKVWCFVERMYTEVLKRTADESGVRTWVGVLQDGSYTGVQVAEGFLMSDEFLAKNMTNKEYVKILYRAFFGRDADQDGLATWTDALANGWTKKRVFAGFANSNEFGTLCQQAGITQGTAPEQ